MTRQKPALLTTIMSFCLPALSACTTTPSYSGFPTPPASLMQAPRPLETILENDVERPVTLREFLRKVNDNYAACHLNAADYSALQAWVRQQQEQ